MVDVVKDEKLKDNSKAKPTALGSVAVQILCGAFLVFKIDPAHANVLSGALSELLCHLRRYFRFYRSI